MPVRVKKLEQNKKHFAVNTFTHRQCVSAYRYPGAFWYGFFGVGCAGSVYPDMFISHKNPAALLVFISYLIVLLAWQSLLDRVCNGSGLYPVLFVSWLVLAAAGDAYPLL
jgi:hypothetical protein